MIRPGAPGAAGAVTVRARAKLNLWLHVVGRRADGYHLLDSLVAFAALGDRVTAAPAGRLSLAVEGPFAAALPADADNLVLRAARSLAAAAGVTDGARLTLEKRLPVAAGIGGGSADAAAALMALIRLWRVEIAPERLAALALAIGADVPVCLGGRPAYVGGIGEVLLPAPPLPPAPLLLINPGVELATPAVFRAWIESGTGFGAAGPRWRTGPADAAELAAGLADTRNDLTAAACGLAPAIAEVLGALAGQPGCLVARMSGSGATCFALFASTSGAQAAAAALAAARPGWWIAGTRLQGAAPEGR